MDLTRDGSVFTSPTLFRLNASPDETIKPVSRLGVEHTVDVWSEQNLLLNYTPHPAPYALHPTPYTLHPTPYTLHPTSHTLHPTPYTLHPTPHTLHPTPYTPHPTPHTRHPAPYTLHLKPHTPNPNPQTSRQGHFAPSLLRWRPVLYEQRSRGWLPSVDCGAGGVVDSGNDDAPGGWHIPYVDYGVGGLPDASE